jgi:hypothetical protein
MASLQDLEVLFSMRADRYEHLDRILGYEDFDFLAASPLGRQLLSRLRKQRVRSMLQTLKLMREDFDSLMTISTLFAMAPTAQAEHFARALTIQRLRFYKMFYLLRARTWCNYAILWPLETTSLGSEIRTLRRHADRILHALTPNDLGAIRSFLRAS